MCMSLMDAQRFFFPIRSTNSVGKPEIALDVVVSADGNSVVAASIPPDEQSHAVDPKPPEIGITQQDEN